MLHSKQQPITIQEEYFEQVIKLFEYLGQEIPQSTGQNWKSKDPNLGKEILQQLLDLQQ